MSPPSPAKPSPLPLSAQSPHRSLCLQRVGLRLERARGPGRRTALARALGSRVLGSRRWRHPERPLRSGPGSIGAPGSQRQLPAQRGACVQGPSGDTRRVPRPVSPRTALAARTPGRGLRTEALPFPTQKALTKLPRARAAPPHVPAPRSVTLGLASQRPRPADHQLSRAPSRSPYTATSGLSPAAHKARPRDPASKPHSRSAPAPLPAGSPRLAPLPHRSLSPPGTPRSPRRPRSLRGPASGAATSRPGGPRAHGCRARRPTRREGGWAATPALGPRHGGLPATLAAAAWLCEWPVRAQARAGAAPGRLEPAARVAGPDRAPCRACLVPAGAWEKCDPLHTGRAAGGRREGGAGEREREEKSSRAARQLSLVASGARWAVRAPTAPPGARAPHCNPCPSGGRGLEGGPGGAAGRRASGPQGGLVR